MKSEVSVIVATYRRHHELIRALDSLANQTFKNFEVIVVDDNGIEEWNRKVSDAIQYFKSQTDIPIHLITNSPNLGSAQARNKGIEAACGNYITFLDDDDFYLPEKIEHQYNETKKEKADFSLTDLGLYNEDDSISEIRRRTYINSGEDLLTCHIKYHMTGTDTMMFKREYLLKIGGFDPINVGDEFYLMLKAINGGGLFAYVPVNDVKAYVHTGDGGLSSGQSKIDGENALYEFKGKYFKKLRKKDIQYIKMRHHAVLAFAYIRLNKWGGFFVNAAQAFFYSPIELIKLVVYRGHK